MRRTITDNIKRSEARPYLRHRLLLMIILASFFHAGCSQPEPPPPPPPAAPVVKVEQEAVKPELSREERVHAIAMDKFQLYERKIKVADFPRAEAALRDVRSVFDLESDYKAFWETTIPSSERTILTLMSLCETCKDGLCPTCKGKAKCDACQGTGKCGVCEGRPIRTQVCKACICSACGGIGKCRNCGGFQYKKCEVCSGYGTTSGTTTAECRRCGGTGATAGLRNSSGTTTIKCLTCKGTGRVPKKILNVCSACGGKGKLQCNICSGSGRCASCAGSGRNASCTICGGAGQTTHKCPQCDGSGKCIKCDGLGQCVDCHGSGKCFECEGGLVRLYDFPVNTAWLTIAEGYVLFDSRAGKVADKDDKPGFKEIKYQDLTLSVIVNPGQIVFIATEPAFDPVIELIKK